MLQTTHAELSVEIAKDLSREHKTRILRRYSCFCVFFNLLLLPLRVKLNVHYVRCVSRKMLVKCS